MAVSNSWRVAILRATEEVRWNDDEGGWLVDWMERCAVLFGIDMYNR